MIYRNPISRRTVLRGIGCAMSLPWLEAMGPLTNWSLGAETPRPAPNRLAFVYIPNGVNMADWTPRGEGALSSDLPAILEPLKNVRDDFMILTGLTADKARAHGDGPGDHARAMAAFLTGVQPHKTDGADIRAGISVDQVAAARLADQTRLASIEIGCEHGAMAGGCDSGYSCVYSSTVSWRSATTPMPKEINPKLVFERLFGTGSDDERKRRDSRKRSLLDFVREDAGDLTKKVGASDKRKLDEYFSAVRDIEQRMDRAEKLPPVELPKGAKMPEGIPAGYQEHIRLMADLMVLAFQADVTRVCSFVLANEGSNMAYPFIGVREGHHDLSHHGGDQAKMDKIKQINIFHMTQVAYLLEKLKSTPEGDGNLLDHSTLVYGSGNSDGNRHNHDDLPILMAGHACGTIKPGRHLVFPKQADTPLNNLWVSLLDRVHAGVDNLGDSTGRLAGLMG